MLKKNHEKNVTSSRGPIDMNNLNRKSGKARMCLLVFQLSSFDPTHLSGLKKEGGRAEFRLNFFVVVKCREGAPRRDYITH
jgi:hypothetical protein